MKRSSCDPESLEDLIGTLLEASDDGAAIIVEGMRDQRSLRDLGVEGPIIMAAQQPAMEVAERAAEEFHEIVVLTDWDRAGDELAYRIEGHLRSSGVRVDLQIRDKLRRQVRREIKDVESLSRYVERMRAERCLAEWP